MKSELKVTGAAGIVGGLPILLELLQGGSGTLTENMMLALLACVTVMVMAYNVSRGMAKTEVHSAAVSTPVGGKSTEFKMSTAVGGLGAMSVLVDTLRGGDLLSEKVKIALMLSITLIAVTYTLSRGMSKTEARDASAPPPPR